MMANIELLFYRSYLSLQIVFVVVGLHVSIPTTQKSLNNQPPQQIQCVTSATPQDKRKIISEHLCTIRL